MNYTDIKAAVNKLLKTKYQGYKIYGKEIREGYDKPSFFVEIIDNGNHAKTKNIAEGSFGILITYFQTKRSEEDALKKADEIKRLFGMYLEIGERKLLVKDYSLDFIGEFSDIPQISVDFQYTENTARSAENEIAREFDLNLRKEN